MDLAEREIRHAKISRKKPFLSYLWDNGPLFDPQNPLLKIALDETPLAIANGYLGLYSQFNFYSLNLTLPMPEGADALGSQRWHRDPGSRRLCKMFIYLSDVDETAGPFWYIKGSQEGGIFRLLYPQKHPDGSYPPEGELENQIPKENFIMSTGRAGTVIFCDTTGFHRGGYATSGKRIMFTSLYLSSDSLGIGKPRFKLDQKTRVYLSSKSRATQMALT